MFLAAVGLSLQQPVSAAAVTASDAALHQRLLVLDTHLDTPVFFERRAWDFSDWHDYELDGSQADLPRMEAGGLDGGFFVVFTEPGPLSPTAYVEARNSAFKRLLAVRNVIAAHPEKLELAVQAADAERIAASGKRFVYISIENSYPVGTDLTLLSTFRSLGAAMAGPVHSQTNQLADSATDETRWRGLSPLGKRWVSEMNRLGMLIDASHASDAAFDQILELSVSPIVLSHSGVRATCNHPRSLDDQRLRRLAAKGGVIQINSLCLLSRDTSPEREEIEERQSHWAELSGAQQSELLSAKAALDAMRPTTTATFETFIESILHAIRVAGIDHVGIGADWDGGGGVQGMRDVSEIPKITARLRREGLSEADLQKLWAGNLLRVMAQAEQGAR